MHTHIHIHIHIHRHTYTHTHTHTHTHTYTHTRTHTHTHTHKHTNTDTQTQTRKHTQMSSTVVKMRIKVTDPYGKSYAADYTGTVNAEGAPHGRGSYVIVGASKATHMMANSITASVMVSESTQRVVVVGMLVSGRRIGTKATAVVKFVLCLCLVLTVLGVVW